MRSALLIVSLVTTVTPVARAQLAHSLEIGSGASQLPASVWTRDTRLASSLRWDRGPAMLFLDAEALERAGEVRLRRSVLDGSVSVPLVGPARLTLGGRVAAGPENEYGASLNLMGRARNVGVAAVSLAQGASGVWMGASAEDRVSGGIGAGAWRSIGNAVITLSSVHRRTPVGGMRIVTRTEQRWDSVWTDTTGWIRWSRNITVADTTDSRTRRGYSELEARLDWSVRSVQLTAVVAGRTRVDSLRSDVWGRLNASMQLGPRVSLVAAVGMAPPISSAARLARFGMVGVRLTRARTPRPPLPAPVRPAATRFTAIPATAGMYRLSLRVPAARSVEVSGDFTNWKPVPLTEAAANTWEVTLPLAAGTHRVNVRVNGETWTAPPGLPAIEDDFNGRVALLVIP